MAELITKASATPARSFAKTISWRALGSLDTLLLGYIFTGSLKAAGSIASTEVVTKIFLYYFHERAWAHIGWGNRQVTVPAPQTVQPVGPATSLESHAR